MGKKKKPARERRDSEDRELEAERQREAEEAELRAEIAALGGVPPGVVDEEEESSSALSSRSNGSVNSYDKAGLESKLEDIALELPFRQTLAVTSTICLSEALDKRDVHDDLKRETAFYQQAQQAVAAARQTLDSQKVPYLRPDDYYAEMVKSDGHMQRVRDSLLFEQKKMKAFEQRKKMVEQKKFGKRLQAEKAIARAAEKRATLEAIKQIRKRRGQNNEGGGGDGADLFDIQLETETEAAAMKQQRGGWVHDRMESAKSVGRDKSSGKSFKQIAKDKKYGFGGGQRKGGRSKRNNESRDDAGNYGKRSSSSKNSKRPGKKRRLQRNNRR